ncbi:MAG TPA: selenoneine synthase SenA [Chloroflexota bacterium]|nr:selenoneine synthase SenA [Chloroflexota bacterium]
MDVPTRPSAEQVRSLLTEVRARTCDLVADLTDEQMIGPLLRIVNPPLWEIGHTAWFQERWAWRRLRGGSPVRDDVDELYDSAAIAHDARWELRLPSRQQTGELMRTILDRVLDRLGPRPLNDDEVYFHLLPLFHEDMHDEALTYTRQTLGYPAPRFVEGAPSLFGGRGTAGPCSGDVEVPGGTYMLGALPGHTGQFAADGSFVFDNEKWAHPVQVEPFRIARAPVTQAEFAAFVDGGGYRARRFWSEAGWAWRTQAAAEQPVYWQAEAPGRWQRRVFDQTVPLEPHKPVLHVNWYEAEAYCNWAGRRLPAEAEWEVAASAEPGGRKRRYPWGDDPPSPERANLDGSATGTLDVGALPAGDSCFGCRQMIGNVWEWTADWFGPYPGFVVDPYQEYSAPWFGNHKVLRGGCWTTRSRLIRNTWRNFYMPDRRDVWCGFRTCAVQA